MVIGVCAWAGKSKISEFCEENEVLYPVAVDVKDQTTEVYKVDGFHDYYLIDRSGRLRVADCENDELEKATMALLQEKKES